MKILKVQELNVRNSCNFLAVEKKYNLNIENTRTKEKIFPEIFFEN